MKNGENLNNVTQHLFKRDLSRFVLLPAILLLVLSVISMTIARYYVTKEIRQNNNITLNRSSEFMDSILSELESVGLNYTGANDLRVTLKQMMRRETMSYDSWHAMKLIQSIMFSQSTRPYIDSIYLYYNNDYGRFISSAATNFSYINSYADVQWYDLYQENIDRRDTWSCLRNADDTKNKNVLSIYMPLFSSQEAKSFGVAIINLQKEYIEKSLIEMFPSSQQGIVVFNESGLPVLTGNLDDFSGEDLDRVFMFSGKEDTCEINRSKYVITASMEGKLGWSYVLVTPVGVYHAIPNLVLVLNIILVCALIIASIPLVLEITRKSRNTLMNITEILADAENGVIPPLGNLKPDSYEYIISNILNTYIEHKNMQIQLEERRYQMQILELQALQSQINPHFLFNTLHTINWKAIALTRGPNEVSEMIENLSTILDYSLHNPLEIVSLEKEIECTYSYIQIIKVRFQNSVQIHLEIEEPIPSCSIPKLLLQPLIENSISHGMKDSERILNIHLSVYREDKWIVLSAADDGNGIPKEKLDLINDQITRHAYPDSAHMGLLNVAKRMNLLFPESTLTIESEEMKGTHIVIRIPEVQMNQNSAAL